MRLLLDTHIFLWFISGDDRLDPVVHACIIDPANAVFLSVVSLWETIIKYQLGKLPLPQAPELYIPVQRDRHHIASLPVDELSVVRIGSLPNLHRDPFDRLLIAQASRFNLVLVTADAAIREYPGVAVL